MSKPVRVAFAVEGDTDLIMLKAAFTRERSACL